MLARTFALTASAMLAATLIAACGSGTAAVSQAPGASKALTHITVGEQGPGVPSAEWAQGVR